MKRANKTITVVSVCLCIAGIIALIIGLCMIKFNFSALSTEVIETNEHNITEKFNNISIKTYTAQIKLLPSEGGECKVVCIEDAKLRHTVRVDEKTLKINLVDERKWYEHISIFTSEKKSVTVYLPVDEYDVLLAETDTGDIDIREGFSFKSAKLESDTGDIFFRSNAETIVDISTDTGDITAENVHGNIIKAETDTGRVKIATSELEDGINIESDTGSITLTDVKPGSVNIEADTGKVTIANVVAEKLISVKTSTGDVKLEAVDAPSIYAKTSTGDVRGTLLSEKVFRTKTSTGKINVPPSVSGGICEITTSTGDVNITFAE